MGGGIGNAPPPESIRIYCRGSRTKPLETYAARLARLELATMPIPAMTFPLSLVRRLQWSLAALLLVLAAWAALAPLRYPTRELVVDFPDGAAAARTPAQVPAELWLTLGVRDVLLLRNRDRAAHVFGQVRVLPGREMRLPFEQSGDFPFACDAAPGARVLVRVLAQPDPGWARLRWRLHALRDTLRTLPLQGPDE